MFLSVSAIITLCNTPFHSFTLQRLSLSLTHTFIHSFSCTFCDRVLVKGKDMQKCVFAKKLVYVDNCECPIEFVLSVCDRERERERERLLAFVQ